ncbi:hypothetical protein [Pseudomonas citronellolis]|uniref:hypothetical protein n=1 Tax=Pseudomonas citronellolis TaxID=53408 RepID=UPI0023E3F002|nr:hypothetical protein [Pseudomonas citronellolis]MDF3935865.1 hypothetical protein [Pseudomonas citronellolis]
MEIRLEAHPDDHRQWRVYLNQYFFQYPSKVTAQRMLERMQVALGQASAMTPQATSGAGGERRRRCRACV